MKNMQIGNIAVKTSKRKRAKFNLTHDLSTTSSFGETQPLQCRLLVPDSKTTCNVQSLVRLAPMVAPTFGRMKFKQWHYFVAMSDLMPNFASLLASEPVSKGSNTFIPENVPNIRLGHLSSLVLCGAHMTIYRAASYNDDSNDYNTWESCKVFYSTTQPPTLAQDIHNDPDFQNGLDFNRTLTEFGNYVGGAVDLKLILPQNADLPNGCWIPLGNESEYSLFYCDYDHIGEYSDLDSPLWSFDRTPVTLEGADYVITKQVGNHWYSFAFRLSAFGKRIRKLLLGLGYQINFQSTQVVSFMPLMAYFKAYFDIFGLTLYQNYFTTPCAKLLTEVDYTNNVDFSMMFANHNHNFWSFVYDLGCCWVTDTQDFVSAHITNTAVSAQPSLGSFISVDGTPNITNGASRNEHSMGQSPDGHAFIDSIKHGALDSELLKRLYLWTNRNTIAGREIEKLLRAQGLGSFVDNCKPRFIGYNETPITIYDVVSTSDTFKESSDGKSGALLGQYSGRGLQSDASKTFTFENEEFGYWIALCAIVPDSGFSQGLDPTLLPVSKMGFYNPEFDGLGYEMTRKSVVADAVDWVTPSDGSLDAGFGYIPRYASLKVQQNVMNGDFNLRGARSAYLPFTLDKFMTIGDRKVMEHPQNAEVVGQGSLLFATAKTFKPSDFPTAGNTWRFNGRYPWLSNFNRIFANDFDLNNVTGVFNSNGNLINLFEIVGNFYDNFMIHNVVHFTTYAPMLPISESFETTDENDGNADAYIGKS